MRYFRRNAVGWPGCEVGIIKSENEFPSTNGKAFNGNEYWEEVIVTPKPQPKTFKKRLCLAIHKNWLSKESFDMAFVIDNQESLDGMRNHDIVQLTDWVEVDFVEKV